MEQVRINSINNNYSRLLMTKEFDRFIKNNQNEPNKIMDKDKKLKFISLPYISEKSEKTARKIEGLVSDYFENVKMIIAFKAPTKLGNHFPFKDKIIKMQNHWLFIKYIVKTTRLVILVKRKEYV